MTTETVDVIEGEAREIEAEPMRALATSAPAHSLIVGGAALAVMSDEEFAEQIARMKRGVARIKQIQRDLLVEGEDFGKVEGIDRPFLQKPGAEKLGNFGGYAVSFEIDRHLGDGIGAPPLSIIAHGKVHLGNTDGPVVAEGVGEANSWEKRYRYRRAERTCPNCGKPAVIKGKAEYGGGWLCWKRKDGCGRQWKSGDPAIEGQASGEVENPDPWDLANTLVKMAKKRAFVDGILTATGTSGLFTQDDDSPAVRGGRAPDAPPFEDVPTAIGEVRPSRTEQIRNRLATRAAVTQPTDEEADEATWEAAKAAVTAGDQDEGGLSVEAFASLVREAELLPEKVRAKSGELFPGRGGVKNLSNVERGQLAVALGLVP